ncbi:hypothetical protein I7I53_10821 [Histoplasma capsulatum var. duboisii H88]|uniref:Uncharacterized protein n=1 Tax=Ajellomyces capsulatus (strain H88) TaxID=544711 RepID=A0A8A1LC16_AJEC8|nr:hypothetical protein I7I53_10821 [Histoplasma capsulatum var. duboisii H88]
MKQFVIVDLAETVQNVCEALASCVANDCLIDVLSLCSIHGICSISRKQFFRYAERRYAASS